jgi:hypothetical protein
VHLEDLVLHDAAKGCEEPNARAHAAHAVLRVRRRIAEAEPQWALSAAGLDSLRGRKGEGGDEEDDSRSFADEPQAPRMRGQVFNRSMTVTTPNSQRHSTPPWAEGEGE